MKSKILKTKMIMYLVLIISAAVFARLSYAFYADDLYDKVRPQVVRAMIQVSKILPELEENEQVIREINDNLEKRSKRVYDAHEKEPENSEADQEDNVETVVDHTLSWMNRVTQFQVGREGHVIVVSQEDYTILAHPNDEYVGQVLYMVGSKRFDKESVPNLEELGGELSNKDISDKFHIFFPASVFSLNVNHLMEALDAGVVGSIFAYRGTYVLCGVTLSEGIAYVVVRCVISTLLFFLIAWVLVRYIGFALNWRKDEKMVFRRKLFSYGALGMIILFISTWYYQTIMDVTSDLTAVNGYAKSAVETLNTYENYSKELSNWLDQQYLEQCRLAADLIKAQGKENVTRQELDDYANDLKVEYIYLYDKNGKVIVTNSPYDHFKLSENKDDQSYAFRALLEGREYVIQSVQKDETSGEKRQYIGVSLRDENDLADGFVQIVVKPTLREKLLNPINVQMVLENLVIGLPDYALAIDKDSMNIVATTGFGYEGTNIEDLGFDVEDIEDGYNVECLIGGVAYYTGVGESAKLYFMPLVQSTDNTDAFIISLKMTLLCLIAFLIIAYIALKGYEEDLIAAGPEVTETDETASIGDTTEEAREDEDKGFFQQWKDFLKTGVNSNPNFERRWSRQSTIPVKDQNPEMRTSRVIYQLLLFFSSVFILYEIFIISLGVSSEDLYGFSYVLLGKWDRGVNLFSFSYCLFLLCVLYVFRLLVNQVLYSIARISDLQHETILLMLRNALRYACAILFLYIGLAQFGIDTRALWASAGVLSLMVGFGAKDLVSDIIAGIFIVFEGTLKIGDSVTVGGWQGTVEKIGIRSTRIGNNSDTKIFNNSSLKDIVRSSGEDFSRRDTLKIPVPYEADLLEIEKLLEKELPLMAERVPELLNVPIYQGVDSFEESCLMLRISINAMGSDMSKAIRAMQREVKLLFDREHISIPYRHLIVKNYDSKESAYVFGQEEEKEGSKR